MKTIGIFCGGFSSEWEISLKSVQTIQEHFPREYNTVKIIVNKKDWFAITENDKIPFDLNTMSFFDNQMYSIDAALIYIHGDPGENGKIQALLDIKGIPYINSGYLASALSFDKWYCNQFLKNFGFKVAESILLTTAKQYRSNEIVKKLGLPLFVKPSDSGSSFGISKVKTIDELIPALNAAFKEGKTVVAESFLDGVEVTCGVYRNQRNIVALPLTEIVSENDFFDYEAKYLGKSNEITPARISTHVRDKVQHIAKQIYDLLQLRSIARIDFMLVDDEPFVIEVNTTPGFSGESIVPKMLAFAEIPLDEFWKQIVETELISRHNV